MGELLKFKADRETYIALAAEAEAKGDYLGAIKALRNVQRVSGPGWAEAAVRIAYLLDKMGLPDIAEDTLFDALAVSEIPLSEMHLLLLPLLLENREFGLAEGVIADSPCDAEQVEIITGDIRRLAAQYCDEDADDGAPAFSVVGDETETKMARLLEADDIEGAEALMRTMKPGSPAFLSALRLVALREFMRGNFDHADELMAELLQYNPRDFLALAVMIGTCYERGDLERAAEYRKLAAEAEANNEQAADYLDAVMRTAGADGIEYFEKRVGVYPFDRELTATLALLYANNGEIRRARDLLIDLLVIFPDDSIAKYLVRLLDDATQQGLEKTELVVAPLLPPDELERRIATIENWLNTRQPRTAACEQAFGDADLSECFVWLFQTEYWEMQAAVAQRIGVHPAGRKLLRRQLVQDIPLGLKRDYVFWLLCSRARCFPVIGDDCFRRVFVHYPPGTGPLAEAYYYALSTLYVFDVPDEYQLAQTYKKLLKKYESAVAAVPARAKKMRDIPTMAGLLLYTAKIGELRTQSGCALVLDIPQQDLKKYYAFYFLGRYDG